MGACGFQQGLGLVGHRPQAHCRSARCVCAGDRLHAGDRLAGAGRRPPPTGPPQAAPCCALGADSSQRPAPMRRRPHATTKWRPALWWRPSSIIALAWGRTDLEGYQLVGNLGGWQVATSPQNSWRATGADDCGGASRRAPRQQAGGGLQATQRRAACTHPRSIQGALLLPASLPRPPHLARQVLLGLELLNERLPRVAAPADTHVGEHAVTEVAIREACGARRGGGEGQGSWRTYV